MTRSVTRSLGLLGASAILVAACGGGTATSAPTQAATVAPATQVPASAPPASSAPGFSFPLPSFQGDAELEAMLPDSIGGQDLTVISLTGTDFLASPTGGTEEIQALLTALGKSPSDLSVAFGGAGTVTIVAFRIKGVPAATIYEELKTIAQQSGEATITNVTLGGKSVQKMVPADATEGISYIYGTQDVVFVVGGVGVTDAQLNEAFTQLP